MEESLKVLISVYKTYAKEISRTYIESMPIEEIYTIEEIEIRKQQAELIQLVINDLEYIVQNTRRN